MNQNKNIIRTGILVVVLLLLVVIPVSLYMYSTTVYASFPNTNLKPQPEKFTELYLENHTKVARTTEISEPNSFSFTIHNLEYKTMKYDYEVYVEDTDGNRSDIVKDSITLKHDEKKTIPAAFVMIEKVKRAKVVVNLINKKQQIHYWIGAANE